MKEECATTPKVLHNYHDYAAAGDNDGVVVEAQWYTENQPNPRSEQNFPVRLHYMLGDLEDDGMENVVSWQSHGRCFIVHDQDMLVEKVLAL
jgi:hypothetical protein